MAGYVTAAEIKTAIDDANLDTDYDAILDVLCDRASRLIDLYTNRPEGAYAVTSDSTRYYDGSGKASLWIDELAAAPTSIYVAETGDLNAFTLWPSTDIIVWPYNTPPYVRLDLDTLYGGHTVWYAYKKAVKIIGPFGYSTDPPAVIDQATIMQTVRWFKRGQQAYKDVSAFPELGSLTYAQALDPEVALLIDHLRIPTL